MIRIIKISIRSWKYSQGKNESMYNLNEAKLLVPQTPTQLHVPSIFGRQETHTGQATPSFEI